MTFPARRQNSSVVCFRAVLTARVVEAVGVVFGQVFTRMSDPRLIEIAMRNGDLGGAIRRIDVGCVCATDQS
jgi:hypothetical protein